MAHHRSRASGKEKQRERRTTIWCRSLLSFASSVMGPLQAVAWPFEGGHRARSVHLPVEWDNAEGAPLSYRAVEKPLQCAAEIPFDQCFEVCSNNA